MNTNPSHATERTDGTSSAYDLGVCVAEHLAGRWTVVVDRDGDGAPSCHGATLVLDADGAPAVHMRVGGYQNEGRVTFRACWPKYADGTQYTPGKGNYLSITCRADRAPAALARELERRLLKAYGPAYQEALIRVRQQDAADGEAARIAERVARAVGGALPEVGGYRRPRCGGTVEVLGGLSTVHRLQVHPGWSDRRPSVHFEVSGLDEETALIVLAVLRSAEAAAET